MDVEDYGTATVQTEYLIKWLENQVKNLEGHPEHVMGLAIAQQALTHVKAIKDQIDANRIK